MTMRATVRQAWAAGPTVEASLHERAGIRQAIDDYCRGWFEADAERMSRALHPALAKVSIDTGLEPPTGLEAVTRDEMVEATRSGSGLGRAGTGRTDVSILGVSGSIACAEVRMEAYTEFLLLVRDDGRWQITASAWRWAEGAVPRSPG